MVAYRRASGSFFESFIVREMDDELLVYDLRDQNVTSLNPLAARVWRMCEATTDVSRIAKALRGGGLANASDDAVDMALDLLEKANLIDAATREPEAPADAGRRALFRRLVATSAIAAMAAPAVVSIVAPSPAQAVSAACGALTCSGATPYCKTTATTNTCVQCLTVSNCLPGQKCSSAKCIGTPL